MERAGRFLKKYFPLSLRDGVILIVTFGVTSGLCLALRQVGDTDTYVPLIFVLAVLVISLLTDGYLYGLLAALLSVLGVNWAFTYPYFELNFSITGYPLTFLTMLAVCFAVSTLTTRVKEQERLQLESEKERLRADFLRAVSHDLRTPLTAISGAISAVLDGGERIDPGQQREMLESARQDADWLYRMVENLLSITRVSGDPSARIRRDEEALEEVLAEAAGSFQKRHPEIRLRITVPEEPLFVPMDALLIEQVLLNLMENAVQHGKTTKEIRIAASRAGDHALVRVADDGCGFGRERLAWLRAAEDGPFWDGGDDQDRHMGIGLLVCSSIVKAHGGALQAEDLPGGGACVQFSLSMGGSAL